MPSEASPIFILGSGRSGTTLLRMMLNAHPNIYISNEASYYLFQLPGKKNSGNWIDFYTKMASFKWLKLDEDEVRARVPRDLPKERFGEMFQTLMQMKAAQYDKPRYGDKTPGYCVKLDSIFKDFPRAKVIHIIRDPRPTIASMVRMPWISGSVMFNAKYGAAQANAVEPFKDKVLEIRLEDLLADREAVLRKILDYIDEPWSDRVLDHTRYAPLDDMPPFPWFTDAARKAGQTRERAKPWQELFSPAQIRLIEKINQRTMERFGYPRAELPREPSHWELWRARIAEWPALAVDLLRMLRIFWRLLRGRMRHGAEFLWPNPKAWKLYPEFDMQAVTDWENAPRR